MSAVHLSHKKKKRNKAKGHTVHQPYTQHTPCLEDPEVSDIPNRHLRLD